MIDLFLFTDPSSSWNKEINQVEPREVGMVKAKATATTMEVEDPDIQSLEIKSTEYGVRRTAMHKRARCRSTRHRRSLLSTQIQLKSAYLSPRRSGSGYRTVGCEWQLLSCSGGLRACCGTSSFSDGRCSHYSAKSNLLCLFFTESRRGSSEEVLRSLTEPVHGGQSTAVFFEHLALVVFEELILLADI